MTEKNQPLVSICVPVYGVEKYIGKCFETLFSQTYHNLEYVVINDCTPDNSIKKIEDLIKIYPERKSQLRIINHEKNRGLAAARNTAVENARGEFLIHVDSDDYTEPTLVEKLVKRQEETNADIVSSAYGIENDNNIKSIDCPSFNNSKDYALAMFTGECSAHIWGRLIRRRLYIDNNIRCEEGVNMGEDFQITPRLVFLSSFHFSVNEQLYYYRFMSDSSYSKKFTSKRLIEGWRSFDIVKDFFASSGNQYVTEINKAELRNIVMYLVFAARYNIKIYYKESRRRLLTIDKKYWRTMNLPMRIQLILSGNFKIMSLYSNFATFIKHKLQ